ncbi:transglycosylase SLT domain-containing protein [Salmonella enterica]|nr:transglycosylase SLT domain-containing protein [Salmonella enterica]
MADVNQYDPIIKKYADLYNVPFDLAKGVMLKESNGNPLAKSPTGPIGLMQISKSAAIDAGINPDDRTDPEISIKGGVKLLGKYLEETNGDVGTALGYYHSGRTGFKREMKTGEYSPETVNYINDPLFAPYIQDSVVKGIANPVSKLNQAKEKNKFSPDLLQRAALNQAPTQAEISEANASMQPSNSILQTQQDYQNAIDQAKLAKENEEQRKKREAYQQLGLAVIGAVLGKHMGTTTQQSIAQVKPGALQPYGNKNLFDFQIGKQGG